ncbi:GIY-YIG nuclease family protein [Tenacibaculum sp. M341]|uniref:GIY-YIG nuclease family protein n=1 Tax=Tenacibaculum sp. M341 TaxID=2530339 RepID=UPI001050BFAB|nr:GIY-YIG nuclease family protein [Tenacibaculum sp. M341]TCI92705.1 GIY-YIG nuclease family protein [Tenacibaculum sp. M341]
MKNRQLYWLTTPCNRENWFVLSTSIKDAEDFHDSAEGFNEGYSTAEYICDVSKKILETELETDEDWWPYLPMLEKLGFKIIENEFPRIVSYKGRIFYEGKGFIQIIEDEAHKNPGVYVVNINKTNKYKIGFTKNLKARLQAFRTAIPFKLTLTYYIETKHYVSLEKLIHNQFKNSRRKGEWFELEQKELTELEATFEFLSASSSDFTFVHIKKIFEHLGY